MRLDLSYRCSWGVVAAILSGKGRSSPWLRPAWTYTSRAMRDETPYRRPPEGLWLDGRDWKPGDATWRPRGTPDCLLILTIGGGGRVRHERGEDEPRPGDALLLLPHAAHDFAPGPS